MGELLLQFPELLLNALAEGLVAPARFLLVVGLCPSGDQGLELGVVAGAELQRPRGSQGLLDLLRSLKLVEVVAEATDDQEDAEERSEEKPLGLLSSRERHVWTTVLR